MHAAKKNDSGINHIKQKKTKKKPNKQTNKQTNNQIPFTNCQLPSDDQT
jgi:hypothetical protein